MSFFIQTEAKTTGFKTFVGTTLVPRYIMFNFNNNNSASPLEVLKARRAMAKAELEAKAQAKAKEEAKAAAKAQAEAEANDPMFKAATIAVELHEDIQQEGYQVLVEGYVTERAVDGNLTKAEQAKAKEEQINQGLTKLHKELDVIANNVIVKQEQTKTLREQAKALREENNELLSSLKTTSFLDRVKALREAK